jgi:hypothetical protein
MSFLKSPPDSRRVRLPYGQLFAAVADGHRHREKSPSRFAPKIFSVGLFAAAILCNCADQIDADLPCRPALWADPCVINDKASRYAVMSQILRIFSDCVN